MVNPNIPDSNLPPIYQECFPVPYYILPSQIENSLRKANEAGTEILLSNKEKDNKPRAEINEVYEAPIKSRVSSHDTGFVKIDKIHPKAPTEHLLEEAIDEMKKSVEFQQKTLSKGSIHTYRHRFKTQTEELEGLLGKNTDQRVSEFIEINGYLYAEYAKQLQRKIVLTLKNRRIIFSPSGNIYAEISQLGKGEFKTTFKVVLVASTQLRHLNKQLRIRAFSLTKPDLKERELAEEEKKLNLYLKKCSKTDDLSHVNVVKTVSSVNQQQIGMMNAVCDGNIDSLLALHVLDEKERGNIALQMAEAISQLHRIDVVHRDIKTDNFLFLSKNGTKAKFVKITDFGTSSRTESHKRSSANKFYIRSTDPLWTDSFSKKIDIFQLGITLCQTLIGLSLKEWNSQQDKDLEAMKEFYPNIPKIKLLLLWKLIPQKWGALSMIPDEPTRNMLIRMVDVNPAHRPTIEEVISFLQQRESHSL